MTVTTERPLDTSETDDGPATAPHRSGDRWRTYGPGLALIALVTILLAVLGWAGVVGWKSSLPEGVALRVDGEEVTTADLEERSRTLEAIYGAVPPEDPAARDGYQRDVAKSVAVSLVLGHAGVEQGIGVSEQQARTLLDGFIGQNYPQGRDSFVTALGQAGTSEAAVLREIELQATTGQLFDRATAGTAPVTDTDVRQAYDTGRPDLVIPEQRRIRNIVLPGRAEADQVFAQLRSGADFASLVSRSLDASTRDSGGDLGLVPASALEKAYGDAAFAAPRSGVFGPVQTGSGWNVGQVTEIAGSRPLGFDEVRDKLREKVSTERSLAVWRGWVADRTADADIAYDRDYRPADPGQLPQLSPGGVPDPGASTPPPPETSPPSGLDTSTAVLSIVQLILAAGLFLLGRWGRSNADQLAPPHVSDDEKQRRGRVVRRGALACQVLAALLVLVVGYTITVQLI